MSDSAQQHGHLEDMADNNISSRAPGSTKVFSIPAGVPFLPTLVENLIDGQFGALDHPQSNPLALANVTILLPTRRAVSALRDHLVERFSNPALILPRIRPLGDIDDADFIRGAVDGDFAASAYATPLAIDPIERLLLLTQLVSGFKDRLSTLQQNAGIREQTRLPASLADAAWLARDLAGLIDFAATEKTDWRQLNNLVPDDYATHWQITLEFLGIISTSWPAILETLQRVDPGTRRNLLLAAEAERLTRSGSADIIIAAGSTGSVPATADLMSVIARLPNGAVVLPALDLDMTDQDFDGIQIDLSKGPLDASHPQYTLKKLLRRLEVSRQDIRALGVAASPPSGRIKCVSAALLPAAQTPHWQDLRTALDGDLHRGFEDIEFLVAASPREEALWTALRIRQAMENGESCALVTADRALARRVKSELKNWQISLDDSRGIPLRETSQVHLVQLCAAYLTDNNNIHNLLAILKHPLVQLSRPRREWLDGVRLLERACFRGPGISDGLPEIHRRLVRLIAIKEQPEPGGRHRLRGDQAKLTLDQLHSTAPLLVAISDVFDDPSTDLEMSVQHRAEKLSEIVKMLTSPPSDEANESNFDQHPAVRLTYQLLDRLQTSEQDGFFVSNTDFADFLDVIFADESIQPAVSSLARYQILGTLEARLQSFDHIIIGGLNEGSWPQAVETDAWLSRGMRGKLELDPPEQRIGLAGHDFYQLMGAKSLTLSRSAKQGGAPTQPSRWLLRLEAFLGTDEDQAINLAEARYRGWADRLSEMRTTVTAAAVRPAPTVDSGKPTTINITDIDLLVRDPYSFYAKNILKLWPIDPIAAEMGPALRGTFIHDLLDAIIRSHDVGADGVDRVLIAKGEAELAAMEIDAATAEKWRRWFDGVARNYIDFEQRRAAQVRQRHGEIDGKLVLKYGDEQITIRGRADRIDFFHDGGLGLYDFKTGTPPSAKQVSSGMAPQLAVEAAICSVGGFDLEDQQASTLGRSISELGFLHLTDRDRELQLKSAISTRSGSSGAQTADDLAQLAIEQLTALIAGYLKPEFAFASRTRPQFEQRYVSDWDHLARVKEWALTDEDADE